MTAPVASATIEVDDATEAIELFYANGWTDGLPVVPPTQERVDAFLAFAGLKPDDLIGHYQMRGRPLYAEKLAINAVMAGCLPEYFPVVIAILQAMLEPEFEMHMINASTGSPLIGFIVNGPVRDAIGMNYYGGTMGPGNRANSTIGRAIRLIQMNVMGSNPGAGSPDDTPEHPRLDRATLGDPGKYVGYHIAEYEELVPQWDPVSVERGFDRGQSTVTVLPLWDDSKLSTQTESTPDAWIDGIAQYLIGAGRLAEKAFGTLIIPPEPAHLFADAGWSKKDIREALWERTRRSVAWVKENNWKIGGHGPMGAPVEPGDDEKMLGVATTPDDLIIVVAGAPAGNFPVYLFPFGWCRPVTKVVKGY